LARADARLLVLALVSVGAGGVAFAAEPVALVGDWSNAERAAIAVAVGGFPSAVRARLPAIARDARRCDAEGWPEDAALVDGAGRAHACAAMGAPAEEVASRVAGALLFAFDRAVRWSEDPAWRRLNKWSSPIVGAPRAENHSPRAFAAKRGGRSPRWDLVTFLQAAWSERDGEVSCRSMSQAGFVRARLSALTGAPAAAPSCAAFERWAELDRLAEVEVVLAAPSTAMVGSLFGHLFLRLVYRDDDGETPAHLSRSVAFLADNDVPFEADRGYAWKGLTGVYSASLHERPFMDAFREYVVTEGRDLRRWRLALDARERRALMERIWTVEDAGQFAYYFFRQNCATLMMDLVEDALPARTVGPRRGVASPPASTLEVWAEARGANGGPLLTFVPQPILSFDHEARVSSRRRAETERRIVAAAPPPMRAELAFAFGETRAPAAAVRAAGYDRVARALSADGAGAAADVYDWLHDSARIEGHLSVLANLQEEARADHERRLRVEAARDDLARALRAEPNDTRLADALARLCDADREHRVAGYRALLAIATDPDAAPSRAARVRLYGLLESEVRYDVARLKREPSLRDALFFPELDRPLDEQSYLGGQADLLRPPISTIVSPSLRSLQAARETVFEARHLSSPSQAGAEMQVRRARDEYEASLPRSGIDQMAVAAGVIASGAGLAPALGVGGALYDERLGDHRRFGFPSDTAFVVARTNAWFGFAGRMPAALAYEARALGYRSLRQPLPEGETASSPLGWEIAVDLRGSRARSLAGEVSARWGALGRLLDRDDLTQHLLLGVDLAYVGAFPGAGSAPTGSPQALAVPVALETRLGLGRSTHRSWLAARASAQPGYVLAGAPRRFVLELQAEADVHIALRERGEGAHDPALVVSGRLLRSTLSVHDGRTDVEGLLAVGLELR
jgi:hypothetical protein